MNPLLVIVAALVVIASVAIVAVAWLLDQRDKLRLELAGEKAAVEKALEILSDWAHRAEAMDRHCIKLLDERNTARNALMHASEELNRERLLRACAGRGFFRVDTGDA